MLADRARFFKESKEGIAVMCKILEDMRLQSYQEGVAEGKQNNRRETALNLLKLGTISLQDISFATGLSLDEVKQLSEEKPA